MKSLIKLYKETDNKEYREWFILTLLLLFVLAGLIFLILFFDKGSSEYYRANSGLFIIDVMVFLIFIGGQQKTKNIIFELRNLYANKEEIGLENIGDILLLVVYSTAMLSFIFVLDLSFIENYGIRIGAVAAVAIIKLLKNLFWARK